MNREMPKSIEAEKSVLGAMFLNEKALQKCIEHLSSEKFYLDSHSK